MGQMLRSLWNSVPTELRKMFKVFPYIITSGVLSSIIAYLQGVDLDQGVYTLIVGGLINILLVLLKQIQEKLAEKK